MKTSIYIPDEKVGLYEQAKEKLGDSISATFVRCLERELELRRRSVNRIVVEVEGENERPVSKAFEGRWVIGKEDYGEQFAWPEDSGLSGVCECSVAITKAGRIVVIQHFQGRLSDFQVFDDFDELKNATIDGGRYPMFPDGFIQSVATELDIAHVEELEI